MAELNVSVPDAKAMSIVWFLIAALVAIEIGKALVANVSGAEKLF